MGARSEGDIARELPSCARLDSRGRLSPRELGALTQLAGVTIYVLGIHLLMIAFLTLELRIEAAHSLKDKRQVTRSLKDRLRSSFNVAVAELEPSLLWNQATIGVVSVSHSRDYLDGLMKNVERAATRIANNAGAEVTDSFVEFL
jgi:uncharacterized protein